MAGLAKARLQPIKGDSSGAAEGQPIEVQFNPTSLRLALSASHDKGETVGSPKIQHLATNAATLSVELHFDTADEGTTENAKSVLERVAPLQRFLLPRGAGNKEPPSKVRFEWGPVLFTGVVESMNVDLDLFSAAGVPLRAKVALSIREQNPDLEFLKTGPGANKPGNAVAPGKAGAGAVGGIGLGVNASLGAGFGAGLSAGVGLGASLSLGASATGQTALAIDGESVAEFAARVGVDPAAWRGIAAGQIDGTLSLSAGAEIDFDAGLSAGAGLGTNVGVEAGASASLDSSFGLDASARVDTSAALTAPGFALSAAGGVAAAVETVAVIRSETAAAETRRSFGVPASPPAGAEATARERARGLTSVSPAVARAAALGVMGPGSPPRPDRPEQARTPLTVSGFPSTGRQAATPPAPLPPRADPRATSFGLGVPLRPRVGGAAAERAGQRRAIPLRPRSRGVDAPRVTDPTLAPWIALPAPGRLRSEALSSPPHGGCACGCGGGCGCGGERGPR